MMIVDSPECPCPIWGWSRFGQNWTLQSNFCGSDRAGGKYSITPEVANTVGDLTYEQKARLTTALIDQRTQGVECPEVTPQLVEETKNKRPLSCNKRAERLLQYIASKPGEVGGPLKMALSEPADGGNNISNLTFQGALAWSESIDEAGVRDLVDYLEKNGWIDNSANSIRVTIEGHNHIETLATPCRNPIGF